MRKWATKFLTFLSILTVHGQSRVSEVFMSLYYNSHTVPQLVAQARANYAPPLPLARWLPHA